MRTAIVSTTWAVPTGAQVRGMPGLRRNGCHARAFLPIMQRHLSSGLVKARLTADLKSRNEFDLAWVDMQLADMQMMPSWPRTSIPRELPMADRMGPGDGRISPGRRFSVRGRRRGRRRGPARDDLGLRGCLEALA